MKYRIIEVINGHGNKTYTIEQKGWLWGWNQVYGYNRPEWFPNITHAEKWIKDRTRTRKVVRIIEVS